MDHRDALILRLARGATEAVVERVAAAMRRLPAQLSGGDSGLKNAWDEYCVQVQGEDSSYIEAYEETVEQVLAQQLQRLSQGEREAIWLWTDAGIEWGAEDEEREGIPVEEQDLIYELLADVRSKAADYSNHRIRSFLQRE